MAHAWTGLHGAQLRSIFDDPQSLTALTRYFDSYTGARFERLGDCGNTATADTADRVTATDLLAVQLLSVQVPPRVILGILEGSLGDELSALLAKIPANDDLADIDPVHIDDRSSAAEAWRLLRGLEGMGQVITSKLLARKRPRLIPIRDTVVWCALGWSGNAFWSPLRSELRAEGHALHHRLLELRQSAGLPEAVSALRVLDVVLWMRHHETHREHGEHGCPGLG